MAKTTVTVGRAATRLIRPARRQGTPGASANDFLIPFGCQGNNKGSVAARSRSMTGGFLTLRIAAQRLQQQIERRAQFFQPALADPPGETVFKRAPESTHVMPIAAPACRQAYAGRPAIVWIGDSLDIARLLKMIHQRTS